MKFYGRSSDDKTLFPSNNSSDFKFHLLKRRLFTQFAKVAILEAIFPPTETGEIVYILSNLPIHTQVGDEERRLLRVLYLPESKISRCIEFSPPLYITLAQGEVSEIRIAIKNKKGEYAKFNTKADTIVLLEIKQQ
jgi:hypothetical protein